MLKPQPVNLNHSAMLKQILEAYTVDIYDLNYDFSSPRMERHIFSSKMDTPHNGLIWRLVAFLVRALRALMRIGRAPTCMDLAKRPVVFFANTRNQELALQTVYESTDSACFFSVGEYGEIEVPLLTSYCLSILYWPRLFLEFVKATGYRRASYHWAVDSYLLTYGYYVAWRWRLRRLDAAAVIVSNDHVMWTRALAQAAKDEHIPTIYVQHASVTEYFPRLSFDYAFLDGYDSLEKYERCERSETQVFLVGMAKADKYVTCRNSSNTIRDIGVCTGHWIQISDVEKVITRIRERFADLTVIVRPHPSDTRRQSWRDLARKYDCSFSDSTVETSFEYLTRVDAVIASDSSILLEAALMNVYPLYYDFPQKKLDLYGYLKNQLVEYYADPEALCSKINEISHAKPDVPERAKHYCATVNTEYEGRTRELVSSLINNIRDDKEHLCTTRWKRIRGTELDAYELAL